MKLEKEHFFLILEKPFPSVISSNFSSILSRNFSVPQVARKIAYRDTA